MLPTKIDFCLFDWRQHRHSVFIQSYIELDKPINTFRSMESRSDLGQLITPQIGLSHDDRTISRHTEIDLLVKKAAWLTP